MSESYQQPLIETELIFMNFQHELDFWIAAAHSIYDTLDGDDKAVDNTNPIILAEMIQEKYPITLPTRQDQRAVILEALAEVHARRVGVHSYRGLWLAARRGLGSGVEVMNEVEAKS